MYLSIYLSTYLSIYQSINQSYIYIYVCLQAVYHSLFYVCVYKAIGSSTREAARFFPVIQLSLGAPNHENLQDFWDIHAIDHGKHDHVHTWWAIRIFFKTAPTSPKKKGNISDMKNVDVKWQRIKATWITVFSIHRSVVLSKFVARMLGLYQALSGNSD